jgi:hypothetical protein
MSRCNMLNPLVDWDEVVKLGMWKWNKKSLYANKTKHDIIIPKHRSRFCRKSFGKVKTI